MGNIGGELRGRLRGKPCRYYPADQRIGVRGYPTYTYSDGVVICGPTVLDERDKTNRTVRNPRLIVEVLSESTEGYDRGGKFTRYMQAESLQEYVLVEQGQPHVQVFFRQSDGTWLLTPYAGLDAVVKLRSIEVELPLTEVYLNVAFPPPAEDAPTQAGV